MSVQFDTAGEALFRTDAPVSGQPCTLMCWFNVSNAASPTNRVLLQLAASADSSFMRLRLGVNVFTATVASTAGSASTEAVAPTAIANNTWYNGIGTFTSNTLREAFANADAGGSSTSSRALGTMDRLGIASEPEAFGSPDLDGLIAHVAIWNAALGSSDRSDLAAGRNPMTISPGNLVAYWPLLDDLVDLVGGLTLSTNGSPAFSGSNPTVDVLASEGLHRMFAVF